MKPDWFEVSEKLDQYLLQCPDRFTLDEAVTAIVSETGKTPETVRPCVCEALVCSGSVFCETGGTYLTRNAFFRGARFSVVPDEMEIAEGILVPGHRFLPFVNPELIPSEVQIVMEGKKEKLKTRIYRTFLKNLVPFHILLGVEEMFDELISEVGNEQCLLSGDPDPECELNVTVFDLSAWYRQQKWRPGDALVFHVEDWSRGTLVLEKQKLSDMDNPDFPPEQWANKMNDALNFIIGEYGNERNTVDQAGMAFFRGDPRLLSRPSLSLEMFVRDSEEIDVIDCGDWASFAKATEAETPEDDNVVIPEGIFLSGGETSGLDSILASCGLPLHATELKAFMLDAIQRDEDSLDIVVERCIGSELSFVDDAQEAFFQNYLEELWEEMLELRDRPRRERKEELRSRILRIIEVYIQWVRYIDGESIELDRLPMEGMQQLAFCLEKLRQFLEQVCDSGPDLPPDEAEQMKAAVEDLALEQQTLIAEINRKIL